LTDFRDQLQLSLGGTYTIDRELGGGGMSRVLVAHDTALRRDIVIKVLPPELVAGVNVERFRREILVAAGLQHPHIVPVLAAGEMDGLPWFTMPFVDGESLRQRIARGPLPINEAVSVLREVAKALAYAHERGVVHRDIKPDNVLLTGGTAMVTDFGIAKALSASRTTDETNSTRGGSLTQIGTSIGTPMYMAPEQAAADPHTDARADLYSFGCVAYEVLAGRPPFAGMSPQKLLAAHMGERPQPIGDLRRDTPPLLAELVMRCLEKDPDNRPQSAGDIVRLLDAATSTTSGSGAVASAVLLGGRVRLRVALGVWLLAFFAAWLLAKAAIVGIGLPSWVLPGALIVAGLGLPVILFTAFVQRTAHNALLRTPTLTPGGTVAPQGTMATIAFKASPHVSWRRTVRGGILAFSAFALLIAGFMVLRALGIGPAGSLLAAGRITAREPLLVTDFTVKNGDSTLAGVVTEAVRASLAQSGAITLVSPATVAAALERMQRPSGSRLDLALARGVAQREGIKAIVDGDVTQIGSGYAVSVRLVSADSGTTLATAQKVVDGPKELIAAADAIGRELRGRMGESLRSVQNAPPLAQVTTASIEALRLYSEGSRAYDLGSDGVTAAARLKQAVAIDTGFAMAWRKLGMVYVNSNYPPASIDSAMSQAYRFRDRLSRKERLATTAAYFQNGSGQDRARAAEALEQILASGDSDIAANNLGLIFESRRQYTKAESLFKAATRTRKFQTPYINLIADASEMRQFAQADHLADSVAREFPSPVARSYVSVIKATVLSAAGDLDRSEQLFDSLSGAAAGSSRSMALQNVGFIALTRGRGADGLSRLAAYRANDARNGVRALPLNDSLTMSYYDATSAEQPVRAVKRLDAALAATPFNTLAVPDRDYFSAAAVYARAGRADKAKAIMAQRSAEIRDTARLRNETPLVHRVLGEIAIAEGRPLDAIREFWKGDSLPDGPADGCDACTDMSLARAYDKANMADSAISHFEKYFASGFYARVPAVDFAARAPAARRLGELYEAKGDQVKAAHYYQMFVDQWKRADPELQPQVTEIRKRLARLSKIER
jgi:tetratricopeptide (TPR) repeat protein/TolB-like protein